MAAVATAPAPDPAANSPQKPKTQQPQLIVQQPVVDHTQALASATQLYGNYLNFSSLTAEENKAVSENVESMLARLDEMGTVIDSISAEHDKMRKEILPVLQSRAAQLKRIFATIDKYQELVNVVKQSTLQMEERVAATQEATSTITVSKIFSLFTKKSDEPDPRLSKSVNIVNTSEWFESARKELKSSSSQ